MKFMSRCNEFKGILEKIHIEKFRKFNNLSFSFGSKLTAIVGQNGTMKTTLLGIISQPFSMYYDKENPEITELQKAFFDAKTLDDYKFESKFADKFKFDLKKESVGDHKYTLFFTTITSFQKGVFLWKVLPENLVEYDFGVQKEENKVMDIYITPLSI